MRKLFAILASIIICFSLYADESIEDNLGHQMIGYVYGSVSFDVSINDSVPFDLESETVQENLNPTTSISGLQIGTYSLVTNTYFKLYITHDKLHLVDRTFGTTYVNEDGDEVEDPGTLSEIDYRFYMATGSTGSFLSCKSDPNAALSTYSGISTIFQNQILIQGRDIDLPNQGLYLSLEDHPTVTDSQTGISTTLTTAQAVNSLKAGTYKSNIYFYLIVET